MKAVSLLLHNIDAILNRRGQTRHELAVWVRQSVDKKKVDPWISGIFTKANREFQMKYLDRIAGFFGLEVYQLFQPGISTASERRKGIERRGGMDRRIGRSEAIRKPPTREALSPRLIELVAIGEQLQGRYFDEMVRWANAQLIRQGLRQGEARSVDRSETIAPRREKSARRRKRGADAQS